jgi:hypothetical protein
MPAIGEANTRLVSELLLELARALLPARITPKLFNELARHAFARAAADSARLRNGRINYSRISAQTGLTRANVRQLLEDIGHRPDLKSAAPIDKVIRGWRTDKRYVGPSGRPIRLRIVGRNPSFVQLAQKYAGDIPHRAILEEMRESRAIRQSNGVVELLAKDVARDLSFLMHALPIVRKCLQLDSRRRATRRRSSSGQRSMLRRSFRG